MERFRELAQRFGLLVSFALLCTVLTILSDREFFLRCPAYFFLIDIAKDACRPQQPSAVPPLDRPEVRNLVERFARHTCRMYREDPALLDPLADYLAARVGCQCAGFVLYHRETQGLTEALRPIVFGPTQGGNHVDLSTDAWDFVNEI
jgi:hypothetical protein